MYPKRRTDLSFREVDGETLVLDRRSGKIHQLNVTASFIWSQCNGLTSIEDICIAVSKQFAMPIATFEQDVRKAIQEFQALDLLES